MRKFASQKSSCVTVKNSLPSLRLEETPLTPNKDILTAIFDTNNDKPRLELSQKSPNQNPKCRAIKNDPSDRRYTRKTAAKKTVHASRALAF